jgi:hypothetical protein
VISQIIGVRGLTLDHFAAFLENVRFRRCCAVAVSNIDGMEISVGDDEMGDRADCENSEDKPTHRRNAVAEDRKKSLHMSTRLTHSLKKRGKMEVGCRVPRIAIEDVKDVEKEQAASSYQKVFFS